MAVFSIEQPIQAEKPLNSRLGVAPLVESGINYGTVSAEEIEFATLPSTNDDSNQPPPTKLFPALLPPPPNLMGLLSNNPPKIIHDGTLTKSDTMESTGFPVKQLGVGNYHKAFGSMIDACLKAALDGEVHEPSARSRVLNDILIMDKGNPTRRTRIVENLQDIGTRMAWAIENRFSKVPHVISTSVFFLQSKAQSERLEELFETVNKPNANSWEVFDRTQTNIGDVSPLGPKETKGIKNEGLITPWGHQYDDARFASTITSDEEGHLHTTTIGSIPDYIVISLTDEANTVDIRSIGMEHPTELDLETIKRNNIQFIHDIQDKILYRDKGTGKVRRYLMDPEEKGINLLENDTLITQIAYALREGLINIRIGELKSHNRSDLVTARQQLEIDLKNAKDEEQQITIQNNYDATKSQEVSFTVYSMFRFLQSLFPEEIRFNNDVPDGGLRHYIDWKNSNKDFIFGIMRSIQIEILDLYYPAISYNKKQDKIEADIPDPTKTFFEFTDVKTMPLFVGIKRDLIRIDKKITSPKKGERGKRRYALISKDRRIVYSSTAKGEADIEAPDIPNHIDNLPGEV